MPHPMIEKVAQAIGDADFNDFSKQYPDMPREELVETIRELMEWNYPTLAAAAIRAALEYARDNVSEEMTKRGIEHADANGMLCELPDDFVGVFRAMTDALLKEIEE